MSDETDWALALSRRDGGHIVQGLPLPQPERRRRLIVLTVAEQPWASRRQRSYCGNLESVDIIINLSCREIITMNQLGSQTEHKLSRAVCLSLFARAHSNLYATNISTSHQSNSSHQ